MSGEPRPTATTAETGQAAVEVVAGAAVLLLFGLVALQLLAAGYSAVMAGHAAEAAAVAVVNGREPDPAARAALPAWPDSAIRVRASGGSVAVTLVPPSPLRFLSDRLSTTAESSVRAPG